MADSIFKVIKILFGIVITIWGIAGAAYNVFVSQEHMLAIGFSIYAILGISIIFNS